MKAKEKRKNIVVIGGGSGIHPVLRGLKKYWKDYNITAIITMTDSGGSTGRLRDQFGQLPVGDVRMALAALSADVDNHGELLRELFLYRFNKGEGLDGHNFGNLLLVALTDVLGSEKEAIKVVSRLLRIRGMVLPVTEDSVHLVAEYDDGVVVVGEHDIDEPSPERENHLITKLSTDKPAKITTEVDKAIQSADLVILGPGDLYSSLLANCVIDGMPRALKSTKAKFVFISNLMSRPGQTRGMKVSDYIHEIEKYIHRKPDVILINDTSLPNDVLKHYKEEGDTPVDDATKCLSCGIIRGDFLSEERIVKKKADVLTRAFIRHDGDKLARVIIQLLK